MWQVKCGGISQGSEMVEFNMQFVDTLELHRRQAVPKDALQEILQKKLCKRVLRRCSEGADTARTRSCGGLNHRRTEDRMEAQ